MIITENYLTMATAAARAERGRDYRSALDLWADAVPLAKNAHNKKWAEARQALCEVRRAHSVISEPKGGTV